MPGIWTVTIGYDTAARAGSARRSTSSKPIRARSGSRSSNYVQFPYDWRLSNRYNAQAAAADGRAGARTLPQPSPATRTPRLVFVGHSMGGLVARYYVDVLGGHEVTAKVITLGTPHRGALNALESLVNGVRKGIGPIGIDLTELARSLPALHQLLPEYACIESADGLQKTTETALPELDTAMVADAMRFHDELRDGAAAHADAYAAHPILARTQPTTRRRASSTVASKPLRTIRNDHGEDEDQKGDGTVPRLSAAPYGVASDSPVLRYVMDKHGALPKNEPRARRARWRAHGDVDDRARRPDADRRRGDDVLVAGEPLAATIEARRRDRSTAEVVGVSNAGRVQRPAPVPVVDHRRRRRPRHALPPASLAPASATSCPSSVVVPVGRPRRGAVRACSPTA